MNSFVRNLITEWRKLGLPFSNGTFIIAVSGGADSLSLTLALHDLRVRQKLDLRFVIAHFNHQLRGRESNEDEQFVKDIAAKKGFELACGHGRILPTEGNLEQNARRARYQFMVELADKIKADGILTGHTLNDQAETFLINLIRGSGLEGLGAMKPVRSLDSSEFEDSEHVDTKSEKNTAPLFDSLQQSNANSIAETEPPVKLIRPLLNWASREDTENYCRELNLDYRYDSMNEDMSFRRVRVRKVLIPLLKDFNPNIVENLAKTASLLQEDFYAIQNAADKIPSEIYAQSMESGESCLVVAELSGMFPSIRRKVIRDWLKSERGSLRGLDSKHLEGIEAMAFSRKSGKIVELPNFDSIVKKNGKLVFTKKKS